MPLIRIALLLLVFATAGCTRKPSVTFGAFQGDEIGQTNHIEYRLGQQYGYRIDFPRALGVVRVREEFTLPGATQWSTKQRDAEITVVGEQKSPEGTRRTKEVEFDAEAGSAYIKRYEIIDTDPRGPHTIRIWLNDRELKTIQFDVE